MRTQIAFASAVLGCVLAACGGDDGGGSSIDAPPAIDAALDAPAVKQIGTPCTPDQNNPAGDCGAGAICLALQDGSGPFCTKTCSQGAGDMCGVGYTGPGRAACILGVMPQGGGTTTTVCGIICSSTNEQICPAATCDGTCPSPLQCNGAIKDMDNQTVAQACT